MATKMTIIKVEIDVDKIVTSEVEELTADTQAKLDSALQAAVAVRDLKERKATEKVTASDKMGNLLKAVFEALLAAPEGVPQAQLLALTAPDIVKAFALTTRFKNYLKDRGNDYRVETKNGMYIMSKFNATSDTFVV